jgi:hypothetical protein
MGKYPSFAEMADASGDMGLVVVLLFVVVVVLGAFLSIAIEHMWLSLRQLIELFNARKGPTE